MAVEVYSSTGSKSATPVKLEKTVFSVVPKNHDLLKAAYNAYLDNGRLNLAVTKTRGKVSGGGRKPWKQKGTGRARFGSSRNPIWRGGGIVFGPTGAENYISKLNVKARRLALRQALSLAVTDSKLIVLEDLKLKSGKTKELHTLFTKINVGKKVLFVIDAVDPDVYRAAENLPSVIICRARYCTVFDVLNADSIVITRKALDDLTDWLRLVERSSKKETK